jgi:hypothetical protein
LLFFYPVTNVLNSAIMYRYLVFALFLFFLFTGKVWSQESVSAQVFAEVIEALAANEDESLNFGRFTPGNNGGAIVITPDGLRSVQGTVIAAGSGYSAGRFLVAGDPGASFTIRLPDEAAVLVHQQSGKTMQVEAWVSDPPSGDSATLSDGSRLVSIGATLTVGPVDENPVGVYAGSFELTFAYN